MRIDLPKHQLFNHLGISLPGITIPIWASRKQARDSWLAWTNCINHDKVALLQWPLSPNSGQLKRYNPFFFQYSSCLITAGEEWVKGSSGKHFNCVQCCKSKYTRLESSPKLGRVTKLFPIKFNLPSHCIHPIASGIWLRPQKLISSSHKKEKLGKDDSKRLTKPLGCKPIVVNFKEEVFDWECSTVSLESSFFKCFGLLNTLEHPERFRYSRELRPNMLFGMLIRFTHPSRFRVSRFGTSPKSGRLIRFLECFRSKILKLGTYCDAKDQQKWRYYLLLFKCFFLVKIV